MYAFIHFTILKTCFVDGAARKTLFSIDFPDFQPLSQPQNFSFSLTCTEISHSNLKFCDFTVSFRNMLVVFPVFRKFPPPPPHSRFVQSALNIFLILVHLLSMMEINKINFIYVLKVRFFKNMSSRLGVGGESK